LAARALVWAVGLCGCMLVWPRSKE
jgi:hypothetical protein